MDLGEKIPDPAPAPPRVGPLRWLFGPGLSLGARWPRLALGGVGILATLYFGLATAGYFFLRHQRNLELRWIDVALPSRWGNYHLAQGRQHLARASAHASRGEWRDALIFARAGLARVPAHREGRLLLARVLAGGGRPDSAQQVLLDGLPYHREDPAYLGEVFRFLLARQQDERAIALGRELSRTPEVGPAAQRVAALAVATASFHRGNYDQAEDRLRAIPELAGARDGRLLAARIDWERGYRDLALLELQGLAAAFPADAEVHGELVQQLRQSGRSDEARRVALAFRLAHPSLAGPRLELLHAYRELGDAARLQREVDDLLRDFPADPGVLVAVAEFAANAGDVPLARRVAEHARQRNLPEEPHVFLVAEALIVHRDHRGALEFIGRIASEHPDWAPRYQSLLNSLQAVAAHGAGDLTAARLFLANFLNTPGHRAENLVALANRFAGLGAPEQARQLLAQAVVTDPLNQAGLTRLVELDLNLNRIDELPRHLQRLLTMRRPSPDVLRVAQHKLGSDLFLYSAERAVALDAIRAALERHTASLRR